MNTLPRLTPTSYALLGLLARESASAYELNSIMQTSMLRVFWPRAESHIYSEPKKLLAHGFVSEERQKANGRQRSVFTISEKGREALAAWLADDGDGARHRNQAEFMLKIILAEGGAPACAAATVERALDTSRMEIEEAAAAIEHILQDPECAALGMPWNGIAANLMVDIQVARYRWGQYARDAIARVQQDTDPEEKQALGWQAYQRALDKLRAVLDE